MKEIKVNYTRGDTCYYANIVTKNVDKITIRAVCTDGINTVYYAENSTKIYVEYLCHDTYDEAKEVIDTISIAQQVFCSED